MPYFFLKDDDVALVLMSRRRISETTRLHRHA